jgi:hypothetical protein
MKSVTSFVSLFLLSLCFVGCEKESIHLSPSGKITTEFHTISDLTALSISDPFEVFVRFSDTERELRIEANENLHSFIEMHEMNGHLAISLADHLGRIDGQPVLKVYLTTSALQSIEAEGAAEVKLQNTWQIDEAELELTGKSRLTGELEMNKLTAEVSGASSISLQGQAQQFAIEATGASTMNGFDFVADQLTADLSGACTLSLTVNDAMNIRSTGASMVHYRGNAVISQQDLSGGSQIIKE